MDIRLDYQFHTVSQLYPYLILDFMLLRANNFTAKPFLLDISLILIHVYLPFTIPIALNNSYPTLVPICIVFLLFLDR